MPRYLSAEWLDAARAATDLSGREAASRPAPCVVVQHLVTGTPDGDVAYHVCVDAAGVRVQAGSSPDPTVVFTEDYDTAAAIGRGELSAQGALIAGRIRVRGDLSKLTACAACLDDIDDLLAELRERTTY